MVFTLPHAGGLVTEFLERVEPDSLAVSEPRRVLRGPRSDYFTVEYRILLGGRKLGTFQITTYDPRDDVTRIHCMTYRGIIPGYRLIDNGNNIQLVAKETIAFDESDLPDLDTSRSNNTPKRPLYRHDEHRLRLANYEIRVNPDGSFSHVLLPALSRRRITRA